MAQRHLNSAQSEIGTVMQRLASGKRINSARDDAAGLAIATRMTAQINGLGVANRGILDSQSMLLTAEGALGAIDSNLQRMRELALQALNPTLNGTDREALQAEVSQLKDEIGRIASQSTFNDRNLIDRGAVYNAFDFEPGTSFDRIDFSALEGDELIAAQKQVIVDQLRNRWLAEAESLIAEQYGLTGDGARIEIFIDEPPEAGLEGFAAYVRSTSNPSTGLGEDIELHINLQSFLPLNPPTSGPVGDPINFYNALGLNDRTIAHEMVHAINRRNIDTGTSRWFEEGVADFIHGADERIINYLAAAGGGSDSVREAFVGNNVTNRDALAAEIGDGTGGADAWNTAGEYAASYLAVKYLDQAIRDTGGNGVRDIFDKMKVDPLTVGVDEAIQQVLADLNAANGATALQVDGLGGAGFTDEASFLTAFTAAGDAAGGGSQFILDRMTLLDDDTGSITGSDYGGFVTDADEVIPNDVNWQAEPLENWEIVWPEGFEPPVETAGLETETETISVQVGTAGGDTLDIALGGANLEALRIEDLDVADGDDAVLATLDKAIEHVALQRGLLGASINRLEMAFDTNSIFQLNLTAARSRIEDADYAAEIARLSSLQVQQQAGIAMLSQANVQPRLVLQLLESF